MLTLEIGHGLLAAILAGLFTLLVVRWWGYRSKGGR